MKFYAPFQISENISETPEGYLICRNVCIGRTGEMLYAPAELPLKPGEDGVIHVVREAKDVFHPSSVASYEGKSITIKHPKDFVNPDNWKDLAKGTLQNVHRGTGAEESDLVADLMITDGEAIRLVQGGLREVSCGYESEYEEVGVGVYRQVNIVGNHLALVDKGRAGSSYAINDHEMERDETMTLAEKVKGIFAKAGDDAVKALQTKDAANVETPEEKKGFVSFDDFSKHMDKYMDAFMSKQKDAGGKQDPQSGKPAEPVAKDAEGEGAVMEMLKKLEERLAKLEGAKAGDAEEEETGDEDPEKSEDEEQVKHDDEGYGAEKATDTAERIEILAPGLKATKNAKAKAVLVAYATKDGKDIIDQFTGGKAPDVKNEKFLEAVFVGASELLREKRSNDLSGAVVRTRDAFLSSREQPKGSLTPEELNKKNEEFYASKK